MARRARAAEEVPLEVRVEHEVPRRLVDLEEVLDGRPDDGRVVDEDVDAAEALETGVERALDVVGARDVALQPEPALAERRRRVARQVAVDVGDRDVRALAHVALRHGAAEPAPAPGHERDAPRQSSAVGHLPPSRSLALPSRTLRVRLRTAGSGGDKGPERVPGRQSAGACRPAVR